MLTPSLTNWRAQYDRMRRSYVRVTGSYASSVEYDDDLHHFMQDCWHLKDWIKNDPSSGIGSAILADYPYLEREDIMQAIRYAAWRAEEREDYVHAADRKRM